MKKGIPRGELQNKEGEEVLSPQGLDGVYGVGEAGLVGVWCQSLPPRRGPEQSGK